MFLLFVFNFMLWKKYQHTYMCVHAHTSELLE